MKVRKLLSQYIYLIVVAGIIIILDQWTKSMVRANLALQQQWSPWPWLEPYARIVHWKNTGAAFGMLPGFKDIFAALSILVSIGIIYYFPRVPHGDWALRLAMGMQLGGAIGNLIDRLTQGFVTDFISVMNFAVFNIADASISIGVAVLIISIWLNEQRQSEPPPPERDDQDKAVLVETDAVREVEPVTKEDYGD